MTGTRHRSPGGLLKTLIIFAESIVNPNSRLKNLISRPLKKRPSAPARKAPVLPARIGRLGAHYRGAWSIFLWAIVYKCRTLDAISREELWLAP